MSNPNDKQLYLKPNEAYFISMAVVSMIEQLRDSAQNILINWTPESRKDLKDMISAGDLLKIKLQRLGFDMRELPAYEDGDENEFLTKQS